MFFFSWVRKWDMGQILSHLLSLVFTCFQKEMFFFFVQKNDFLAGFAPGEVEGFNVTMLNGSLEGDQNNWPWNQSAIGMENTRPL